MISLKIGRKSIFANMGVATMTSLYGSFCINCDDEAMKDFWGIIGNKAKNLYELKHIKGISIPEWFVVTSETFDQYVKDNEDIADLVEKFYDLQEKAILSEAETELEISLKSIAEEVRKRIISGTLSKEICDIIRTEYTKTFSSFLSEEDFSVSVRSSCAAEDSGDGSFAGIYDTFLYQKTFENVLESIKQCWASIFNERAVYELIRHKVLHNKIYPAVVVQRMIDAKVAGTAFSMEVGTGYNGIEIVASYGVGEGIVSGEVDADKWLVNDQNYTIIKAVCGEKQHKFIKSSIDSQIEKTGNSEEERHTFCLDLQQIKSIAISLNAIKGYFRQAGIQEVDTEFAFDKRGVLYFLQARPLVNLIQTSIQMVDPQEVSKYPLIANGNHSVMGVATGRLNFIASWEELASGAKKIQKDDIVVAYVATNTWTQFMKNFAGMITQEGSPTSHPMLLCRERKLPCVIGLETDAFENLLKYNGQEVTLDGFHKKIYLGNVPLKTISIEDLKKDFAIPQSLVYPSLEETIKVLERYKKLYTTTEVGEGIKHWVFRPHYKMGKLLQDIHYKTYAQKIPELIGLKPESWFIETRTIDDHVCTRLVSWEESLSHFAHLDLDKCRDFNDKMGKLLDKYMAVCNRFEVNLECWHDYIDVMIELRSYLWVSLFFREYVNLQINKLARKYLVPEYYLNEYMDYIQSNEIEYDVEMRTSVLKFAQKCCEVNIASIANVIALQQTYPSLYGDLIVLAKAYRFNQNSAYEPDLDLDFVWKDVVGTLQQNDFNPQKLEQKIAEKTTKSKKMYFCDEENLSSWIEVSVKNRVLQSNGHHIQIRDQWNVREKLLNFASSLVTKGILNKPKDIFDCTILQVEQLIKNGLF